MSGGDVNLIGLSASDPVPGNYFQIDFAAGPASGSSATYAMILIGGMLSTGTATADTVVYGPDTSVPMTSEADFQTLFGNKSELHRMGRRVLRTNTTVPLYAIAVSEGGSAAASTGTITIANTATGPATLRIWIGDTFCDTGIQTGDTPTTIATNAIASINAMLVAPVVATNTAGVITITALQKGLRSNLIRYFAAIQPNSITTTVTPVASTTMTGGTVSDSLATALTTIAATNFYYIVLAAQDATQLGLVVAQVGTQAGAITGIRQSVYAGSVDTLANTITITTGLNSARAEVAWLAQSDVPPCELAAHNAAAWAAFEAPAIPRLNFNYFGQDSVTQPYWQIKAPMSGAAPTRSQISAALNAGISPIGVGKGGATWMVKRATTRFLNGSNVDYRIRAPHKRLVCDRYCDDLQAKEQSQFSGKVIGDDPINNGPLPGGGLMITPRVLRACVNRLTRDYGESALLQGVQAIIANTNVGRSSNPTTRLYTQIPLTPVDLLDQIANDIQQVG